MAVFTVCARPLDSVVRKPMEPTREPLRRSHTDENLRSYPADAVEVWGIIFAVVLIILTRWVPLEWAWPFAVVGAVLAIASIVAWFKRKFERYRKWKL